MSKAARMLLVTLVVSAIMLTACVLTIDYVEVELEEFVTALEAQAEPDMSMPKSTTWQEAFASLLRENYAGERFSNCGGYFGRIRFFLHDMDMDGLPELFVLNSIDRLVTVYTFRNGAIVPIEHDEYDEYIPLFGLLHGAARMRIGPAPEQMPGFVFAEIGPSAGMFGTSSFFWRVVIDINRFVIADYGERLVDAGALHEIFDNFGHDADPDELDAARQEHTHILLNGNPVTEEELDRVFGRILEIGGFPCYDVTEENIRDIIFGWPPRHRVF